MTRRLQQLVTTGLLALLLVGCAIPRHRVAQSLDALLPADVILLGEQHDADAHRRLQRAFVETLADRAQLAGLALEMADRGRSTAGLARDADAQQVRDVLRWNDSGWPWARYAPVVMAAVRRGIPVLGANLPGAAMRPSMSDTRFDQHLSGPALARQRDAIRTGHCNLLPEERLMPMLRVQLARDASMAGTVMDAIVPGKTVLLIAGGSHVLRDVGVPTHLPPTVQVRSVLAVAGAAREGAAERADWVWETAELAPRDYCAELRRQFQR